MALPGERQARAAFGVDGGAAKELAGVTLPAVIDALKKLEEAAQRAAAAEAARAFRAAALAPPPPPPLGAGAALAGLLARTVQPFARAAGPVVGTLLPGAGAALAGVGKAAAAVAPQAKLLEAAIALPRRAIETLTAVQRAVLAPVVWFAEALTWAGRVAGEAAQHVTAGFRLLGQALGQIQSQVVSYVRLADPGAVVRFTLAAERLQAAIGRALAPLLERLTTVVDRAAAAVDSLGGGGRNLLAGLAGAGVGLTTLAGVLAAAGAAVALLVTGPFGIAALAAAIGAAGLAVAFVTRPTAELAKLADRLGRAFVQFADAAGAALAEIGEALMPAAVAATAALALAMRAAIPVVRALGGVIRGLIDIVSGAVGATGNAARDFGRRTAQTAGVTAALPLAPVLPLALPLLPLAALTKKLFELVAPEVPADDAKLRGQARRAATPFQAGGVQDFFRKAAEASLTQTSGGYDPAKRAEQQRDKQIELLEKIANQPPAQPRGVGQDVGRALQFFAGR